MDLFTATDPLRRRPWLSYPAALLLAWLALQLRFAVGPALVGLPFITFFSAVLFAAYLGGRGPGTFCAVVSGLLALYYLIEPIGSFAVEWPGGWLALGFYALASGTIVLLVDTMNRAYRQVLAAERERARINEVLEARVRERTAELEATNAELRAEIAARADAEAQAAQLQRIETIGQLTGGIAHDFNNLLGIIIGNLDLAQRRLAQGRTDIVRYIDGALDGANRGATLTRRLLAFARRQPLQPAVTDANALVSGMSELLRRTLGEGIELECVLAGGLWRTCVDPGQLEAAIVNTAVNARDAMPEGGKLTIETMNAHLDDAYVAAHPDAAPGQYVLVAVTDTGEGMTPEVAARAFEPFYTTKEAGRGTGLGLSQIYGYLKQSGGHAKIYSEAGQGTTVKLYFPRYTGMDEAAASGEAATSTIPPGRAAEIILVVEDEAGVRDTAVETLRELGYTVRHAADGRQALAVLDELPGVTLLFTDVVMPGLSGRELADEAQRRHPGLKVLYTTGYTRNAIVHGGRLDPHVELLQKPYRVDELARKVRAVLDK